MMKNLFILFFVLFFCIQTTRADSNDDQEEGEDQGKLFFIISISQSLKSMVRPVVSSIAGGTRMYIKAKNHDQNPQNIQVFVGNFPCIIPSGGVDESYITCDTTACESTVDIYNLPVTVINNQKAVVSKFPDLVNYQWTVTPLINQLFPSVGFSQSYIYIYGTNSISNVGDGKDVGDIQKIMIGDHQCKIIDIPQTNYNTYIKCLQQSEQEGGKYNITLKLKQGQAQKNEKLKKTTLDESQYFHFTLLPTISSISANKGDEGGQKLKIKGTGFSKNKNNNTVTVDGNPCKVTQADNEQLSCILNPRDITLTAKLSTNTRLAKPNKGYISGAGLNYIRYSSVIDIAELARDFRAGVPSGEIVEKGFRAQLKEFTYNSGISQVWSGYFTAPVDGTYTFRGYAKNSFSFYLSQVYGSAELPAYPLIYSYSPTSRWSSFYYDDISTAQAKVNLIGGKSYYMQAYHSGSSSFFKISVDVPNNNTNLSYQTFQVHKLFLNTSLQPEVVTYSMSEGTEFSSINLKIVRKDSKDNILYNKNVTIPYGCSPGEFYNALRIFDSFNPFMMSVERKIYDENETLITQITDTTNITRYDYEVSFFKLRPTSVQNQNFIVKGYNFTGNFTKMITIQHSPLISGTFSFTIGGTQFNNIAYNINEGSLQAAIRSKIKGYEKIEVEFITTYGCEYWCTWIISYRGVDAAIPDFIINTASLKGGITQPDIIHTIRRPYSPSIIFEPIDYRFLGTASSLPSVLVNTNGLPAICTGNCSYEFIDIGVITSISYNNNRLTLIINYTISSIKIQNIYITVDGKQCKIQSGSIPSNMHCTVQPINGQIPLTAGINQLQVQAKPYGIIKIKQGTALSVPLIVTKVSSSSGGLNGGSINTLFGSGFSPNKQLIKITICNQNANIINSTYGKITFFMPPCEAPGTYSFLVKVRELNNSILSYNYNLAQAPIIASLHPKSSNPTKKTKLYIYGSGYESNPKNVSVHLSNSTGHAYQLKILSINQTCIQVGLPGGLPGKYTVEVAFTDGTGLAKPSSPGVDIFSYEFSITSVTPDTGSYFGGTLLNISGINFSPEYSDTLIYVGYQFNWFCRVQSITESYVTCRTPPSHPNYENNQSLEISMSTKLYMTSECPQKNCFFAYMDKNSSPNLTSISTSVASTSTIIVTGNNFLLNSSVYCEIVLSNQDGSQPLVLPTLFCNSTSAQFVVKANVPAASYYVKVRNSIGESNPLKLTVNLVLGTPSLTSGSTQGAFVTFTGGSGYPVSLGGKNYISLYAPTLNSYYSVNVTNYSSGGFTIQVPPNPNSTTLNINFVTQFQTKTQTFISSNSYTPSIIIASQEVLLPEVRNITFQRNDTLTSLPILRITLVSTIDNSNNISIPLWNTTSQTTYSFSARLYAGSYKILAQTSNGFCKTNSTINVQANNGSSITTRQVSFAGDRVYIVGSDLSPSSHIKVNGFVGNIVSYNTSGVIYKVPIQISASTQNYYKLKKVSFINPSLLATFSDNNNLFNSSSIIDGDKTTLYGSISTSCWVGVDVGQNLTALIDRITYFPQSDWVNVAQKLIDAVFEGSKDKVSWDILGKIDQSVHIGWNTIKFNTSTQYRYIRFKHNSASQCNLAEMKLYGIISTNEALSITSQSTNVVYQDGYNKLSYTNALQFRLDKTPVVNSVTPPYGDIFGGYSITIAGKYLNATVPTVFIDSISCTMVSANQTHIICTVGARPNIPKYTNFTVLVGTSEAVMNANFLYVLKWSDQRTWGVDLPPIDGDLVFVPAGMTLLVDQSTPHLLGITAQDGTIIFSNETDITVYAGFITMNGGTLIAGTQSNPLFTNLEIILEGNISGAQQPIFGNKGIGCLDCKLSIYGKPRKAWTTIQQTINPGDASFTVSSTVDWKVGEQIAVASTSFDHQESESKFITSVNGNVFTVNSPFANKHVSIVQSYGSSDYLSMKAEVGLLSRNIKITGDDESNTTQYGAHLLATKSRSNNLEVQIGYTEFTQCGQPHFPGRYCIFFSKARQVPTSFVRGSAVHNSYARLIGLNKVEYLTIENNVGYRIKGHNIFLQSGTQIFNTIRGNLIISSLEASNLLQSDYSVASFWITHPNNHLYDNHAAGSDYYGISYQIGDNTEAISDICPLGSALGYVANNVIHSNKNYGMRIYKLYSRTRPCLAIKYDMNSDPWAHNPSIPSVFSNFIIYKNSLYGVLAEQVGHLVFNNFTVAQNYVAGIQIYIGNFTKEMVSVTNSTIIGRSKYNYGPTITQYQSMYGVVTPRAGQSNITNTRFYNFVLGATAIATCSQCVGQYATNVGNQIFIKNIQFSSIDGRFLSMIGYQRDIIYDLDGSLSSYFFNEPHSSATIVYGFNHISKYNPTTCRPPKASLSSWSGLVMCDSSITIRRIMFTNIIGTSMSFTSRNMFVCPIVNVSQVINQTNINTNIITVVPPTSAAVEKPYSWSLPYVTGTTYQVWWGDYDSYIDYNHLSITTTPLYTENDQGVVFKIPYILNRELYNIGPMRNLKFPTNDQLVSPSVYPPVPSTCINGEYSYTNDVGSRMLSICQSGKNKAKYQYTQVNGVFCKYLCPAPPPPTSPSSVVVGVVIKESFVRLWSNASQWPNQTIPRSMQDVYINANWTILLDMDPYPANYMIIDGTVVADDTRDVFITAKSIHIRAGNISVGNAQTPFTHKFTIQINNTYDHPGWVIDPQVEGNKFITVTGSLNLYGSPPSSVITELTQTAFAKSSLIYVSSSAGWQVGDSIALSPSFGNYQQYERVTIQSINANGSISIYPALKSTHYGSSQHVSSTHGSINVNTKVGHLTRNIRIAGGPDYTWGLDILVYGYVDGKTSRKGTVTLNGVQIERSTLRFLNTRTAVSTITSCSVYNSLTKFLDVRTSNQISFSNNFFFNSASSGVAISQITKFNFNNNLIVGVNTDGCFSLYDYLSPSGSSIKNNFCLGAANFGFAFPHIKCSELSTNSMANNTAGSCSIGFIFNNIETSDKCKAFSYIKAYACKIGQICNPIATSKLVFDHFILADNERGATLKFGSDEDDIQHIAQLSYSYITAVSRPSCTQCYGQNAIKCSNNIGMRLLSVSGDGQSLYSSNNLQNYDNITTPQKLNSKAYLSNVIFDNFKTTYPSSSCANNYVFRPHTNAHDAVATHVLTGCSCTNCHNSSYLLADPNNPNHIGWSGGCGSIACTGKSNYLIIDPNGTFIGSAGTIVPNKMIGQNEPQCYYSDSMNAFNCFRSDFTILAYKSTAADYNTRIMWPVNLSYEEANYSTITNGWREWDWLRGVPQNHRLGRFLSIVKLNSVYNMTFASMPPLSMELQLQKRGTSSSTSNYIVVKLRYPLPNLIRLHANGNLIDPIPLIDSGLKRPLNKSKCGDYVFYKDHTSNFVITEGDCLVKVQLLDMVQLKTKFAMTTDQFFTNSVMSSYISNLCLLLGIKDTSRIKIVGVLSGSIVVNTVILPPINATVDNTTSTNGTNSTQPSVVDVQLILSQSLQSGNYSSSMLNATGYQVLTGSSTLYLIENKNEQSPISSPIMLIAIVISCIILIIVFIMLVWHCKNKRAKMIVHREKNSQKDPKDIVASDSVLFSNESAVIVQQAIERDHQNSKSILTSNMRKTMRRAKKNTNLQIKDLNQEPIDLEE